MNKSIKKIGFCIHFPELINHFQPIWDNLEKKDYCVLVDCPTDGETQYLVNYLESKDISFEYVNDCLSKEEKYEVLVSNHPFAAGHDRGIPHILKLGKIQVRMMYALGKAKWNFAPWNGHYHTILCWGAYHAEMLAAFKHARLIQVGYPRFDSYRKFEQNKRELLRRFDVDPGKETIVWLPTWKELSSIDAFAESITALQEEYNLLLKLHPNTLTEEPERVTKLSELGLNWIEDTCLNNSQLIAIADWVLADYGGSAFAAIYAEKKLILLNKDNADKDELAGQQSLDILLRQWLPSIDQSRAKELKSLISSNELTLDKYLPVYKELKPYFFKDSDGNAGALAAEELKRLLAQASFPTSTNVDIDNAVPNGN